MSHRKAKRKRKAQKSNIALSLRSHYELVGHLREQLEFLRRSAHSFDGGFEGEAKRLATIIRVLVHDTGVSSSVLRQLGVKDLLPFVDTAMPIRPRNLLPTEGLLMIRLGVESGYVPPLGDGPPDRYGKTKPFGSWWADPVSKLADGRLVSRRDYVLTAANREGGAHVNPALDPLFDDFVKRNPFGWVWVKGDEPGQPLPGNAALIAVRQIAYEMEQTILTLLDSIDEELSTSTDGN